MNKIYSFCVVFLLAFFIGCDSPVEPTAKQNNTSTSAATSDLSKWGSNYSHEKYCDGDHERDEDCNSKLGNHDKNCDRFHSRNSDKCNHDRIHAKGCNRNHDYNEVCNSGSTSVCDSDGVVILWAGKNTNVGSVTVTQDLNNVYIEYKTTGTWVIKETHLDISTQNYSQRGAPGLYDYQSSNGNGVTSYKYTIPKTWPAGTKLYFLAHAVVGKTSSGYCGSTETAYGGTIVKPNNGSWYGTFCYTVQGTPLPPTYAISGYVYYDTNLNGVQDNGELGLAGVVVTLDETTSTITDANGYYSISNLIPDTYSVVATSPNMDFNLTTSPTVKMIISNANGIGNFGYAIYSIPDITLEKVRLK